MFTWIILWEIIWMIMWKYNHKSVQFITHISNNIGDNIGNFLECEPTSLFPYKWYCQPTIPPYEGEKNFLSLIWWREGNYNIGFCSVLNLLFLFLSPNFNAFYCKSYFIFLLIRFHSILMNHVLRNKITYSYFIGNIYGR